jgi:hypothetical protein
MIKHFRSAPIQLGEFAAVPESEINTKIQILRVGTFHHPEYGVFNIRKEHLLAMQKNFDAKVRGVDVAIDYAHESHKEAAAWVKAIHISDDGNSLWAEVSWTPRGKETLIKREYRYLSADFTFDYQDNESLEKFGPVLFGAGLTNRPVVKNMAPAIELSEGKGLKMKTEEELAAEKAAEKAAEEKKAAEDKAAAEKLALPPAPPAAPAEEDEKEKEIVALKAQLEEMKAKCAAYEIEAGKSKAAAELAERNSAFNKLMSEGKVVEAQRQAFMDNDAVKLAELSQPVNLGSQGNGAPPPAATGSDPSAEVIKLAEQILVKKEAKTLSEAISKALHENPELAKRVKETRA